MGATPLQLMLKIDIFSYRRSHRSFYDSISEYRRFVEYQINFFTKFGTVKGHYDNGRWTERMVRDAVSNPPSSPWITVEEYEEITGEAYWEGWGGE